MNNNRDSTLNKRNKLNDVNKAKYENPKKAIEQPLNNCVNSNASVNCSSNNNKKSNVTVSNQLRNDTYESVCSPEDVAERTRMAQRHPVMHNNTNGSSNTISSNISNASNSVAMNNVRPAKRVVSPVTSNDSKGEREKENPRITLYCAMKTRHRSSLVSLDLCKLCFALVENWQLINFLDTQHDGAEESIDTSKSS